MPWSARSSRCTRSSASPAATSPAPGCWTTRPPARSAASPCPRACVDGSRLPQPIFTPATKAALGDHDENVTFESVVGDVGPERAAELRELTLAVYARAEQIAREQGIIVADTKLEFGARLGADGGATVLGDEVLTPDSSRFWPAAEWEPGRAQASYDKQIVRNWLTSPESRVEPWVRRAAAAAARGGRRAHPAALRRGLRAAHRRAVLMLRTAVEYPVPVAVAYAYLADPANRPEWQSSLRSVDLVDPGPPHVGQRWRDRTAAGIAPEMVITEMTTDQVWAETGRWQAMAADLTLRFSPRVTGGCRVDVSFGVRGAGLLRPVGWAATAVGAIAVRADLGRAGRILEARRA